MLKKIPWLKRPKEQLVEIYLTSVGRGSTLLFNIPPDRRGLIHGEKWCSGTGAVAGTVEWTIQNKSGMMQKLLLLRCAEIQSNSQGKCKDNNPETYWVLNDEELSGTIDISFGEPRVINYVLCRNISAYASAWNHFAIEGNSRRLEKNREGTTIGYKRIVKVDPVETGSIRISINDAKACPVISTIEMY